MEYLFRALRADEIEVRVSKVNEKGCSLLLYKNARCDMNILDETYGPFNWERKHYECKGNLYCSVSIKDSEGNWITKSDCGAESYSEKEKGEASDSFKRACFNWGIGRELYTAPFIWVNASLVKVEQANGKYVCKDSFSVEEIDYIDRKITRLTIVNKEGQAVYTLGQGYKPTATNTKKRVNKKPDTDNLTYDLYTVAAKYNFGVADLDSIAKGKYSVAVAELTNEQVKNIITAIETDPEKLREWLKRRA